MTPITRPMTSSVVSPIVKKDGTKGHQEPLYRRAKAANMAKEIPKIPLVSFGPSSSHPMELYHLEDENGGNNGNNSHNNHQNSMPPFVNPVGYRQNSLGNIRLPRVPAQNSAKS